jgi:exosortase
MRTQTPAAQATVVAERGNGVCCGWTSIATLSVFVLLIIWGYWTTLVEIVDRWWTDPQYTHGFFVPVFAAFLLWQRRDRFPGFLERTDWTALIFFLVSASMRLVGAYYYYSWLELLSLLPAAAGLCVLVCGRPGLKWGWAAIAFLFFMLPLPYRLQAVMASPLQRLATQASTYALQTVGFSAVADGTTIALGDVKIRVAHACSGLSMMLTFFALSAALALLIKRPLRDKVVILLSAIPIALIANVTRVTLTGICHKAFGTEAANAIFHAFAGWLMMPLALAILGLELYLLPRLLVEEAEAPRTVIRPLSRANGRFVSQRVIQKGSKARAR